MNQNQNQISDEKIKELSWAFNAFYGMDAPFSFKRNVAQNFTKMLTEIYNDICIAFPNIEKTLARKATETMLTTMRDLGAKSPNVYFSDSFTTAHIITTGFEYALRVIKGKPLPRIINEENLNPLTVIKRREIQIEATRRKQAEDEELSKRHAERAPIAEALYKEYHSMKQGYINNGEEVIDAKLQAWAHVFEKVWDQKVNYAYHVITYKIPFEEDLRGDPFYIKMLCNNPVTQKLGKILTPKEGKKRGDLENTFQF